MVDFLRNPLGSDLIRDPVKATKGFFGNLIY
jgi:hypothetical protein